MQVPANQTKGEDSEEHDCTDDDLNWYNFVKKGNVTIYLIKSFYFDSW